MPELSLYFVIVCIIEGNNRFVDHLTHGHVSFSTAGKAELLQLNCTQFLSLGIFVSKKVGNRKN